jgi:hypothetical protein
VRNGAGASPREQELIREVLDDRALAEALAECSCIDSRDRGFGPFLRRQAIDFDAFADDGVFLIGGRTGAGKSSTSSMPCASALRQRAALRGGEKRLRSDLASPRIRPRSSSSSARSPGGSG